jgi:hypothetical protein
MMIGAPEPAELVFCPEISQLHPMNISTRIDPFTEKLG